MNFISKRKYAFILSAFLIIAGVFSLATNGLNLGIDFTGGTIMHVDIAQEFSLDEIRDVLAPIGMEGSSLQKVGIEGLGEGEKYELLIKAASLNSEQQDEIFSALSERFDLTEDNLLRVESVGSTIGGELKQQALLALIIACIGMVIYITVRFEYRFAIAAIGALIHDAILVLAFFSIFRLEINLPFVAAILTILGYSINDTIVIFDRIRENMKRQRKENLAEVVNSSINLSLRRSINTSVTTLLVLVTLFAFGGMTLRPFISALLVGVIFGTYSSIFIASPLWMALRGMAFKQEKTADR